MNTMRIKKGDNVIVIAGKDKGKKGVVSKVLSDADRVVVDGVNMRKKHLRPRKRGKKGQIVDIAVPIHVSNVAIVDPKTKGPTRIGIKTEKGKKVRVAKKSGTII